MSEFSQSRLESRIIEAINMMIVQKEIKNPRLSDFVSVTKVTLSKDNAYASCYVSCLIQENGRLERSVEALQRSAGFIQSRLGAILKTKNTPRLTFVSDVSLAEGQRMVNLLESLTKNQE